MIIPFKNSPCNVMISTALRAIVLAALAFLAVQNHYLQKSIEAHELYAITRDKEANQRNKEWEARNKEWEARDKEWGEMFKWGEKTIKLIKDEAETTRKISLKNCQLLEQLIQDLKKK